MTPDERAREFVIKMQFQKNPLKFEQAKYCALILASEIYNEVYNDCGSQSRCKYWKSVIQSIEKL